jgi:hypothetical protein
MYDWFLSGPEGSNQFLHFGQQINRAWYLKRSAG